MKIMLQQRKSILQKTIILNKVCLYMKKLKLKIERRVWCFNKIARRVAK